MRPSSRRAHKICGSTKKKKSLAKKKKKIEKQAEVVDEDAELFRLLKLRPQDEAGLKRIGDEELFSKGHANCRGEYVVCLLPMPLDPTQIGRNTSQEPPFVAQNWRIYTQLCLFRETIARRGRVLSKNPSSVPKTICFPVQIA